MNPRRKKRLTIVLSIFTGLAVVAGLVLFALSQNIDLFYTPSEIYNGKDETGAKAEVGQRIRIGGLVVPGSVHRDEHSLKVNFQLSDMKMPIEFHDDDIRVVVRYDGILPDLFREGQGIVANGVLIEGLKNNERIINASEVLAKHDENYMPAELADKTGKKYGKATYTQEQLKGGS